MTAPSSALGPAVPGVRPLWVSERLRTDPASLPTEGKREALIEYQTLFDDLLTAPGAVVPRGIQVGFVELPK